MTESALPSNPSCGPIHSESESRTKECPPRQKSQNDRNMLIQSQEHFLIEPEQKSLRYGVVSCLHALRAGRRQPKGRHRDLESRALAALPAG
eukprot:2639551-Amphidinium_carterae.1